MENGDERPEVDRVGVADQEFRVYVLQLHSAPFLPSDGDHTAEFVVTAVRGVDEKLRLVNQITARIRGMRGACLAMRVKKILCELSARKGIPELLRIEIILAKLCHDLVGIFRNGGICDLHERLCSVKHGTIGCFASLLDLSIFKSKLRFEDFPFGGTQIEGKR